MLTPTSINAPMPTTVWKRKENPNKENCRLTLIVEDIKDEWYIDMWVLNTHNWGPKQIH
jgi:hypothetical protein